MNYVKIHNILIERRVTLIMMLTLFITISCKSSQSSSYQSKSSEKSKQNYLAEEAGKVIEYNKEHKKEIDTKKEKLRREEEKNLNELNHKKHTPEQHKKKDAGEFKMY